MGRVRDASSNAADISPLFTAPRRISGRLSRAWSAAKSVHSGSFMLTSQDGDVRDAEQLSSCFEVLTLVVTLVISYWYGAVQTASNTAATVNANAGWPLGTLLNTTVYGGFVFCWGSLFACFAFIFTIKTVFDTGNYAFVLTKTKTLLLMPWSMWMLAVYFLIGSLILEQYVKAYGLDQPDYATLHNAENGAFVTFMCALLTQMVSVCMSIPAWMWITDVYERGFRVSSGDTQQVQKESVSQEVSFYAHYSGDDLRRFLRRYLDEHDVGKHPFANPNPEQFDKFVLSTAHLAGHHTLSYMTRRMVESVFEDDVQQKLAVQHVKVERDDIMQDLPDAGL